MPRSNRSNSHSGLIIKTLEEMVIPPFGGKSRTTKQINSGTINNQPHLPFNPGPMRNNSPPPESEDLEPLEVEPVAQSPITRNNPRITKPTPIHFLEEEPMMPRYSGGNHRPVKIKPLDKDLFFDGSNMPIEKFIKRYEAAARTDGATQLDLASQISPFIKGLDLKDEVEEMSGYEDCNWEILKKQLLNRFGSSLPLVKYTRHDLKDLVYSTSRGGGIRTSEHFKIFRTKFEAITHYLVRMGYSYNLEEFRDQLLESLSEDLEAAVTKELIRDNQMLASKDGGDILPDTETLLAYIHKEVQSKSVMDRRKICRGLEYNNQTKAPSPFKTQENKAVEELTKTLSSWHTQKPSPFFLKSHVPYKPAQQDKDWTNIKCNYCHQVGHSFSRCNQANQDELKGLFKKEGNNVRLPDGTPVPWDRNRAYKLAVDQYHQGQKQPGLVNLPTGTLQSSTEPQASLGELEEIDPSEYLSTYDCDIGKRTRSGKEYEEESSTTKKVRKEKEDLMEVDRDLPLEYVRKEPISPPTPIAPKIPVKKVQIQAPEDTNLPKEKPTRKTYLERPLAKEYPDSEERVVSRMLSEGKLELSFAEILAISNGTTEALKKKISPKRLPLDPVTKSINSGDMKEEVEEEEEELEPGSPHYACPLGYIDVNINEKSFQALLDNGSQVNLLPRNLASRMGLIVTQRKMNLKGIGGHKSEILGIAEGVTIKIGNMSMITHFYVSAADIQPILGTPWLKDMSATIKFNKEGSESLSIIRAGKTYLVPIAHPTNQRWEKDFPIHSATTQSHFLGCGTSQE